MKSINCLLFRRYFLRALNLMLAGILPIPLLGYPQLNETAAEKDRDHKRAVVKA